MKLHPFLTSSLMAASFCVTAAAQRAMEASSVSMAIVLDTSGSMAGNLAFARRLISEMTQPAISTDEFALIQASDRPIVLSGFASGGDAVQTQLDFTQSKGRSALLDAIYLGVQVAKAGRNPRKVVLVISDGQDNSSRYTEIETKNAISEGRVRVYVIRVGEPAASPGLLSQIAEYAGGRYFGVERGASASQVSSEVGMAVRERR